MDIGFDFVTIVLIAVVLICVFVSGIGSIAAVFWCRFLLVLAHVALGFSGIGVDFCGITTFLILALVWKLWALV